MRFLPKLPAVEMQRVASLGSASRLIGITFGLMALATFAVHTEHLVQHRAGSATALLTLAIVFCAALVSGVVGFACSALAGAGLVHLYARPSDVIGLMLLCSIAIQHADKGLTFSIDGDPGLAWQIDEGDAFELLGNVMDNAAKWARQRVAVAAWRSDDGLHLRVDDDGPGFSDTPSVLQLHVRGGERVPGHGVGLAVVDDLVASHGGALVLSSSDSGGARRDSFAAFLTDLDPFRCRSWTTARDECTQTHRSPR